MQSVLDKVVARIYGKKRGWVFTPIHFSDLGSASDISSALSTLSKQGRIRRLSTGLYDYPRSHPKLGELAPNPETVAKALAGRDGTRLQPAGAHAANLLGLSLQVPSTITFLTDGTSRTKTIGNQTISLKRTTPKNMAAAGRVSGLVIQALRHLGKDNVDSNIVQKLRTQLSRKDIDVLKADVKLAPAWIRDIINKLASDGDHIDG